eukprot:g50292.t1
MPPPPRHRAWFIWPLKMLALWESFTGSANATPYTAQPGMSCGDQTTALNCNAGNPDTCAIACDSVGNCAGFTHVEQDMRATCRMDSTVTCYIAIDNELAGLWYHGVDVLSQVTPAGALADLNTLKQVSFSEVVGATLAVRAKQQQATTGSQTCRSAGFLLKCNSTLASSPWHNVISDNTVAAYGVSTDGAQPPLDSNGLSWTSLYYSRSSFNMLCDSTSTWTSAALEPPARKIWGSNRFSFFIIAPGPSFSLYNPSDTSREYSSGTVKQSMLDGTEAWLAATPYANEYVSLDLGAEVLVSGVVTQGRASGVAAQYVTGYTVQVALADKIFGWVDGGQVFSGNADRSSKVTNTFRAGAVVARYVRVIPNSWVAAIAMRLAVYAASASFSNCYFHSSISLATQSVRESSPFPSPSAISSNSPSPAPSSLDETVTTFPCGDGVCEVSSVAGQASSLENTNTTTNTSNAILSLLPESCSTCPQDCGMCADSAFSQNECDNVQALVTELLDVRSQANYPPQTLVNLPGAGGVEVTMRAWHIQRLNVSSVVTMLFGEDSQACLGKAGENEDVPEYAGPVVSVSLLDKDSEEIAVSNLTEPIMFWLPVDTSKIYLIDECSPSGMEEFKFPTCSYYDTAKEKWRSDGCVSDPILQYSTPSQPEPVPGQMYLKCSCTHLTEFTVLLTRRKANQSLGCAVSSSFLYYSGAYFVTALLSMIQGFRCFRLTPFLKGRSHMHERKGVYAMFFTFLVIAAVALLRFCASLRYGSNTVAKFLGNTSLGLSFFLATCPLLLLFWLFSRLVTQWASISQFPMQRHMWATLKRINTVCWVLLLVFLVALMAGIAITFKGEKENLSLATKLVIASASGMALVSVILAVSFAYYAFEVARVVEQGKTRQARTGEEEKQHHCCRLPRLNRLVGTMVLISFLGQAILWLLSILALVDDQGYGGSVTVNIMILHYFFEMMAMFSLLALYTPNLERYKALVEEEKKEREIEQKRSKSPRSSYPSDFPSSSRDQSQAEGGSTGGAQASRASQEMLTSPESPRLVQTILKDSPRNSSQYASSSPQSQSNQIELQPFQPRNSQEVLTALNVSNKAAVLTALDVSNKAAVQESHPFSNTLRARSENNITQHVAAAGFTFQVTPASPLRSFTSHAVLDDSLVIHRETRGISMVLHVNSTDNDQKHMVLHVDSTDNDQKQQPRPLDDLYIATPSQISPASIVRNTEGFHQASPHISPPSTLRNFRPQQDSEQAATSHFSAPPSKVRSDRDVVSSQAVHPYPSPLRARSENDIGTQREGPSSQGKPRDRAPTADSLVEEGFHWQD